MYFENMKRAAVILGAVTLMALGLALPAVFAAESSASEKAQEETVYQTFKRKANELFGSDEKPSQSPPKAEPAPQDQTPQKKSDGKKMVEGFKKRMQTASDNLSETVDRDKKTVEKKMQKLFGDKKQ